MRRILSRSIMVMLVMLIACVLAAPAYSAPTATLHVDVPNAQTPVVEFGSKAKLTATLASDVATIAVAGQTVTLAADAWPFDGMFVVVATATTSATGTAVFTPAPVRNTNYRVDWATTDTATTPATNATVSSAVQLVNADLKFVSDKQHFTANQRYVVDLRLRGDATLDLRKQAAFVYIRINNKGRWTKRATAFPKATGSVRSWKLSFSVASLKGHDTFRILYCSKDEPDIFGIGRLGAFPLCGRGSFTQAQLDAIS